MEAGNKRAAVGAIITDNKSALIQAVKISVENKKISCIL